MVQCDCHAWVYRSAMVTEKAPQRIGVPFGVEEGVMQSSLIGKIEKAQRYAQERDRIKFSAFTASFRGENADHTVSYEDGQWHCSCSFFSKWGLCSHTMALQKILVPMLPEEALSPEIAETLKLT